MQVAQGVLEGLLAAKAISVEDITSDADLQNLGRSEWFQRLLSQESSPEPMLS